MKIIDLLNKIANGEEVPKKIKYNKHIYEYEVGTYDWSHYIQNNGTIKFLLTDVFNSDDNILDILNIELEIIEDIPKEDKKIEKLKVIKDNSGDSVQLVYDGMKLEITLLQAIILDKINEIIDKVNGDSDE